MRLALSTHGCGAIAECVQTNTACLTQQSCDCLTQQSCDCLYFFSSESFLLHKGTHSAYS